ncbi:alpha/beta hydrolase [Flavobacterium sp. NKUCC04_CG]|uniref:alpha/beta hydrolase n=1 Tax=Flavobacterium sp. NKUCC04_CG TaxID=2842121 RepID=UPI001C5A83E8|nr:alpha/beta hydrolase [Flavobacterium sp. NKUCC04_CG]MBW3519625.1 alpha/beta hydrolase [Flavobacterium sp. NKUCC04_CG]
MASNATAKHRQNLEIPKPIRLAGKTLQFFSLQWATRFAMNLFTTPLKFKAPKRELEMDQKSEKTRIWLPKCKKDIIAYHYGAPKTKKALLVHGWNGRGTQLVTIANMLLKKDYKTISFDATGHGRSPKNKSNMTEFIEACFVLQEKHGPFDLIIGHSLGGMATINAIKQGLNVKKAIIIGSGDVVQDIISDFVKQLELSPQIAPMMQSRFEKHFNQTMESFCVHQAAAHIDIPVLVIHDENDLDVPVTAAQRIYENLKNGEIMITKNLGHRKILGDKTVIERIKTFINPSQL